MSFLNNSKYSLNMPQTSPINWILISIIIISSTFIVNISFNKKTSLIKKNNSSIKKKTITWKW